MSSKTCGVHLVLANFIQRAPSELAREPSFAISSLPGSFVQDPELEILQLASTILRLSPMAAVSKTKYDRQLRIWGEQGQEALEKASICLLNCGPTGSEALKNLVLGGVGSITVVDGTKVEKHDLGNNFMLDEASLLQSKAKCVCAFLQELNDAVKAKFVEASPEALIEGNPLFFSSFTLVIATQEHIVVESKPEHFVDDLRLQSPWPELKEFAKTIDLNEKDPIIHKHTPYVVILIHIAEKWGDTHGGCLPTTRQEKKEFKDLIKAHMLDIDEENYKEAIESSYKVSIPHEIIRSTAKNYQSFLAKIGCGRLAGEQGLSDWRLELSSTTFLEIFYCSGWLGGGHAADYIFGNFLLLSWADGKEERLLELTGNNPVLQE
ncbi:NEDD8-activating enzyme E1 regulatory subunit [Platanthera guangdongensis]|uniref:NEDD8-activating enzyme E1 regulatory subunit n=1 Tax=Platanthera guangdongensis TaxID=2320717 RepID=A0ABR2MYL2_9ASPA